MGGPAVLIVSASTGTGHLSAAEALRETAHRRDPSLHVEHVDLLQLAPRWVRSIYGTGFEMVVARVPRLWKGIYYLTDGDQCDRARWAAVARRLLFREFRRLLESRRWDVCLCTHFLPCQLAAGHRGFPPFALAMTDFTLHRFWIQRGVDRYFVATDTVAAGLARHVAAPVEVTGIPIRPDFAHAPPQGAARAELGLAHDRPVALVIGGGLGIGVEEAALGALAGARPDVQVVAVCGRNEGARLRLEALGVPPERLRVLGYVRGIERYFAAADLVATKAGGLTVSEALALGKPLLLTRPIPGAEEGNTRGLAAEGVALAALDGAALRDAFARAFDEPGLLDRLSREARRLGRPAAAETIVDTVRREYLFSAAA